MRTISVTRPTMSMGSRSAEPGPRGQPRTYGLYPNYPRTSTVTRPTTSLASRSAEPGPSGQPRTYRLYPNTTCTMTRPTMSLGSRSAHQPAPLEILEPLNPTENLISVEADDDVIVIDDEDSLDIGTIENIAIDFDPQKLIDYMDNSGDLEIEKELSYSSSPIPEKKTMKCPKELQDVMDNSGDLAIEKDQSYSSCPIPEEKTMEFPKELQDFMEIPGEEEIENQLRNNSFPITEISTREGPEAGLDFMKISGEEEIKNLMAEIETREGPEAGLGAVVKSPDVFDFSIENEALIPEPSRMRFPRMLSAAVNPPPPAAPVEIVPIAPENVARPRSPKKSTSSSHAKNPKKKKKPRWYCEKCKRHFNSEEQYWIHVVNHNKEENVCDMCEHAFASPNSCALHMRRARCG